MSAEEPTIVKCLVWDLDNTLWNGTLVEDDRVEVDDTVREMITDLDSRGILQSIASRNDHDEAWAQLDKLGLAEYFLAPRIHWGPKSQSVREIADEMDFALSTIAFVDDMPAERAEVAHHLPEVRCYSAEQVPTLTRLPEFSPATVTVDARRRREMYQAGLRREQERESFPGADEDFLRSLELEMTIARAQETDISRLEELTRRTSQMNATGVHYSDETLRRLVSDEQHEVLVVSMEDRFGPHGAVGVLLLETHAPAWHIKLLATSCRVVSFGAGSVLLQWLIDAAARAGVHLAADFRRTDRNRMMEVAYRFAGLGEEDCDCLSVVQPTTDAQLLHLAPERQEAPATMHVFAADLMRSQAALTEWR